MSKVYIIDGNPRELQTQVLDAMKSGVTIELFARHLGGLSVDGLKVQFDVVRAHLLRDEDSAPTLPDDESHFPIKLVAVGRAAIDNAMAHSATLTIHEQKTDITPVGELEVLEAGDLG